MTKQLLIGALAIIANHCLESRDCKECYLTNFCKKEFGGFPEDWELGDLSEEMQQM